MKCYLLMFCFKIFTVIYAVEFVRHQGHIVGVKSQQRAVERYVYDFNNKVYMLMSHFSYASSHTLNVLFAACCMSLYVICLWDLTSTHCESFYTTWKKPLEGINRLNPRSHSDLLHDIINDNFLPRVQSFLKICK